jgi:(p)ppGpp synthase/HD superfamily hydrolase
MKPTVKSTINLIKKAHAGQKYGSDPYWTHPLAVAEKGKDLFGSKFTVSAYLAALLHDTVEDTDLTLSELQRLGYNAQVLDVVELVTKDKSLNYEGNIRRIIQSGNKLAMMVKFADNFINYTGDKSGWDVKRVEKSQSKYLKSMQDLGKVLDIRPEDHLPS